MRIKIKEIKIGQGRRKYLQDGVDKLTESIREIGLMNPITVTKDHVLIAGLHRLVAARQLGWEEIECTVLDTDELHAELAEIDENYVRTEISPLKSSQILLRRKEIYETLHPETKAGAAQGEGMKRAAAEDGEDLADNLSVRSEAAKPFAEDTADKLGVDARTVRRQVQIAKNLTPEAQEVIEGSDAKVTQQNLMKLSRLAPEQQAEAAAQLVEGKIKSPDDYGKAAPAQPNEKPDLTATLMPGLYRLIENMNSNMRIILDCHEGGTLSLSDEQYQELEKRVESLQERMHSFLEKVMAEPGQADDEADDDKETEDD